MNQNDYINMFILNKGKYFPSEQIMYIKDRLQNLPPEKVQYISSLDLKDPTLIFVVSLVGGGLGVDRFLIGDIGMGILKLLTGGLCGILVLYDWFTISKKTRNKNFEKLLQFLQY